MEVSLGASDGRDLHGGDQAKRQGSGRVGGLSYTPDGVVVGEREQLDPGFARRRDHRLRGERSVGVKGMTLKVEGWSRGGAVSTGGQQRP